MVQKGALYIQATDRGTAEIERDSVGGEGEGAVGGMSRTYA